MLQAGQAQQNSGYRHTDVQLGAHEAVLDLACPVWAHRWSDKLQDTPATIMMWVRALFQIFI
jgi:hypothetical protein